MLCASLNDALDLIVGHSYLRYTKGNAPLGKTPLYTLSIALLILEDSTRRSNTRVGCRTLDDPHPNLKLTVDEKQEYSLLGLIVGACTISFRGPSFRVVGVAC
jgi:hypothetical protein